MEADVKRAEDHPNALFRRILTEQNLLGRKAPALFDLVIRLAGNWPHFCDKDVYLNFLRVMIHLAEGLAAIDDGWSADGLFEEVQDHAFGRASSKNVLKPTSDAHAGALCAHSPVFEKAYGEITEMLTARNTPKVVWIALHVVICAFQADRGQQLPVKRPNYLRLV